MAGPKIYDANEVSLVLMGLIIDSGFGDGEFIRIEQETDDFTDVAGTDGEVTRSKTNDKRATITVTLMQTSEGNSKLTAINNLDRKASNGAGVGPFLIKDKSGLALYMGTAWVAGPPTVVFDREATAREWKLRAILSERFDGGS